MVHSTELKFSMHIIQHRPTYCIDFREFRINSFFTEAQKKVLLQSKESNYQNYASLQTVFSIKLKFDMYIVDTRSSYYINFGVSRRHSFLQDTKMS